MKTDLEIQKDVIYQLKWEPFITSSSIGVAVKNGIVTLSGTVDNYAQKLCAERAVKKISGVKALAEDIQIGVSPIFSKTDTEIAESVISSLKWHSAVPDNILHIKVDNGIVTLEGEVEWEFQRNSAKNAVANLLGVRGVNNLISIKPKVFITDIKNKIELALHRSATIDAEKVGLEVDGGKVILRGKVRSNAEKEDVEDAVWCASGVTKLESYLEVEPQETYSY